MFIPYAPKGYIPILIKIDLFAGRFRLRREAVKTKAIYMPAPVFDYR